jgi:hypothetical protein
VSAIASLVGGVIAYGGLWMMDDIVDINTFWGIFAQGLVAGLMGLAAWLGALFALKSEELSEAIEALRRRGFIKQRPVVPEGDSN